MIVRRFDGSATSFIFAFYCYQIRFSEHLIECIDQMLRQSMNSMLQLVHSLLKESYEFYIWN